MSRPAWLLTLGNRWFSQLTEQSEGAYLETLGMLPPAAVDAAIQTLAADGRFKIPTPGQIAQRVAELDTAAPPWVQARSMFLRWREDCRRLSAERRRVEQMCEVCDGTGFVWIDEESNTTTQCECREQLRQFANGRVALPPVLRRFVDDGHLAPQQIDQLTTDTTLEAQVRDRWEAYAALLVRDHAWSGLPVAPGVPAIEAARDRRAESQERAMPRALNPLQVMGLLPEGGSRDAA